jgi:glycosyltransferase involved in cell wall biosynthesis
MTQTAAIFYVPDGFDTSGQRLLGRQAAGEGFLKGLIQHGASAKLFCYADSRASLQDFVRRVQPWSKRDLQITWIPHGDARGLASAGTLYRPDLLLEEHAWQRRYGSPRDFSLCGVTHTIATRRALDALGRLLLAPVEPWDALICTSQAVREAVERIHGSFAEYLRERCGATEVSPRLKLPVIPLGVDTDKLAREANPKARGALRSELSIGDDEIVVLYVGRLIHYAKAHPVPMYLALEKAARRTGKKLCLIQAGWFEQEGRVEQDFKEAAARLCPSVRSVFLDGRKPAVRATVWAAADIFMSLSDNVQETFGITPIEAMAAGLPALVSDWDGYKESVRDGVDGFRVPTVCPAPGAALDWAAAFGADVMNYSTFIANAAMVTSVDVEAAADALTRLVDDAELRRRLGEAGQQRAREIYDWRTVIRAYEQLWQELGELRAQAPQGTRRPAVPHPLCDDPFRLFGHYASAALSAETRLAATPALPVETERYLRDNALSALGREQRAPAAVIDQLLATLRVEGPLSVEALVRRFDGTPPVILSRTLVHLLKLDLIARCPSGGLAQTPTSAT